MSLTTQHVNLAMIPESRLVFRNILRPSVSHNHYLIIHGLCLLTVGQVRHEPARRRALQLLTGVVSQVSCCCTHLRLWMPSASSLEDSAVVVGQLIAFYSDIRPVFRDYFHSRRVIRHHWRLTLHSGNWVWPQVAATSP